VLARVQAAVQLGRDRGLADPPHRFLGQPAAGALGLLLQRDEDLVDEAPGPLGRVEHPRHATAR
jgi:hypothetical protein